MVAIEEVWDANGALVVYKGYCIQPTCYTLNHVKVLLGEVGKKRRTRPIMTREGQPLILTRTDAARGLSQPTSIRPGQITPPTMQGDSSMEDSSSPHPRGGAALIVFQPSAPQERPLPGNYGSNLEASGRILTEQPAGADLIATINSNISDGVDTWQDDSLGNNVERNSSNYIFSSSSEEKESEPSQSHVISAMREAATYGDFTQLMCLLEGNQSNKDAVIEAFTLLCRYVREEHQRQDNIICVFGSDAWVKSLNTVINDNAADEEIQGLAASAFAVLSSVSKRYMLDIVKYGGAKIVLSILDKYKRNPQTVDSCCCALFCMIDGSVRAGEPMPHQAGLLMHDVMGAKTVEGLISAMGAASSEGKSWAMSALLNLSLQKLPAQDGKTFGEHVRDADHGQGINVLIGTIKSDTRHAGLAQSALQLLLRLSVGSSNDESTLIASKELVTMVVSIVTNIKEESIHESAFTLLGNALGPIVLSAASLMSLSESISVSMTSFHANEEVQIAAMKSLSSVLRPSVQRDQVMEWDGLVSAIIVSMNEYQQNMDLQRSGCLALATIASGNDSCKLAVVSNGGVSVILKAIRRHVIESHHSPELSEDLRLYGCTVFASLAASPLTCPSLNDVEVISTFVEVVQSGASGLPASVRASVMTVLAAGVEMEGDQQQSSTGYVIASLMNSTCCEDTEMVISTLSNLCKRSSNALSTLMVAEGGSGIDRVMGFMSTYIESQVVQEAGCDILAEVFFKFPFQGQLGITVRLEVGSAVFSVIAHSEEALISIRKAITIHKSKASLVAKAFAALAIFLWGLTTVEVAECTVDEHVKRRVSGLLKDCMDALSVHQDDLEVLNRCLELIRCLLLLNDQVELRRWSSFLIDRILIALRLHLENNEVKINACSTLLVIITEEEDDNAIGLVDQQLFSGLLLKCIASDSEDVVEMASELAATVIPRVVSLVGHLVDSPDSMGTIVGCMFRYPGASAIIGNCCSILASVSTLHDNYVMSMIADSGGVTAILDAMDNHQRNEIVQESAFKALQSVSRGIPREMLDEMKSHIAETTLRALQENTINADIESPVLEVIWYLCSRAECFKKLFSAQNAIQNVIEVMNQNLHDRSVQGGGCAALWSLTAYGENKHIIGDSGGLRSIINALLAHLDAVRIQKEGLAALKNLATTSRNKQLISAYGGEDAILISMRANMKSEDVLAAAFSALNNISVDTANRMVAQAPVEIFDRILVAMRRYKRSEAVQTNAVFLLKSYTFAEGNLHIMQRRIEEFMAVLTFAAERFPTQCRERVNYVVDRLYETMLAPQGATRT